MAIRVKKLKNSIKKLALGTTVPQHGERKNFGEKLDIISKARNNTTQHNTTQHNTTQHNTTL